MDFKYVVLGAGRQGQAAAYDMVRFGAAREVMIADLDAGQAQQAADRVNNLSNAGRVSSARVDAANHQDLVALLRDADVALSAVPYALNLAVARACIATRTHLCDLGGNTDMTWSQLALDPEAREAGISIVPDCGLQPGMGNTLAVYAMSQMATPEEVRIWVGGLAQDPRPPFDFLLTFNVEGLTNEYDGHAVVIQDGRRTTLPAFSEVEEVEFAAPVGRCEAFITTGGTSTCPWTFEGKLKTYVEKTVRYPGHAERFRAFRDLGLFGRVPITTAGCDVIPRDFYHSLLQPLVDFPDDRDVVVLRVSCTGHEGEHTRAVTVELTDFYESATGFRAMERTTGWPAAIVAELQARGQVRPGATPLELAVPPEPFVAELRRRGFDLAVLSEDRGPL